MNMHQQSSADMIYKYYGLSAMCCRHSMHYINMHLFRTHSLFTILHRVVCFKSDYLESPFEILEQKMVVICRYTATSYTGFILASIFQAIMDWKVLVFLIWMPYSESLEIDRSNEGLEVVPRNLDISVSILILAENILETLNSNSFDIYFQLTEINLKSCKTTYIEDGTFDNQDKLTKIRLGACRIMQLPRSFGPSTATLQHFEMYDGFISGSIFKHPYFAAFPNLHYLDIGGGGKVVESFNASILPSNIDRFRMDFSRLPAFPDFRNQSKLSVVTVIGNWISIIPQEHISTLSNLIWFRASKNDIKTIPNFSHMILLSLLELNNNDITLFPHAHISGLISLDTLKAGNNLIHKMPNVSYLPKLELADFSNNLIRHVPASCLHGLPMIKTLDMNNNMITSMDDNSVPRGELYLHDNQLASPPDLYDMKVASLTLRGNPLVCDQLLCWLRMWPFDKTLPLLDDFFCAAPLFPNGSLVMDIHPVNLGCYKGKCYELRGYS